MYTKIFCSVIINVLVNKSDNKYIDYNKGFSCKGRSEEQSSMKGAPGCGTSQNGAQK